MKSLIDINIEKSRSGVYKDNPENRRLHRVGQRYGSSNSGPTDLQRTGTRSTRTADEAKKMSRAANLSSKIKSLKGELDHHREELDRHEANYDSYVSNYGEKRYLERYKKIEEHIENIKKELDALTGVSNRNESSEKESRARELARVRAMTNDELAAEYFGYDPDRYKKADEDYKKARSSFVKKWGAGLQGMISHISSMKDIEKLLKDSTALLEKQRLVFDSSPFTSKILAALRTRITNAAKKGKDIKNLKVVMSVEPERGFWKDGDFLAKIGENFASNLIKDTEYTNNAKMGNTLFWTESGLKYGDKLKLSAEEHNKLASIIAGEQGNPENYNERGEAKIGGYEDFKNVVEGLGSGKKENSEKEGKFSRVNLPDIPNARKVNLTKYLSAKRKKAVDDAWDKAKFDSLSREKKGVFQEGYNKLRDQFNNSFDDMSKSERAELLYKILKMKNTMERK